MSSLYTTRTIPYQPFEIDALEGWLDEMAKNGFLLESFGLFRARFKKAQPSHIRYRIDVTDKRKRAKLTERRAYYKDCGWAYIASLSSQFEVYKAESETTIELNTDPDILKAAMRRHMVMNIASIVLAPILTFLVILHHYYFLIGGEGMLIGLMENNLANRLFCWMIMLLLIAITGLTNLSALIQFKRREKNQQLLSRSFHTGKRAKIRTRLSLVSCIAALVVFAILLLGTWAGYGLTVQLENYNRPLPFPLLEEINTQEWEELSARIHPDPNVPDFVYSQYDNYIMLPHRLLAPRVYMTRQYGPSVQSEEGRDQSDHRYTVNCYQMWTETLAVQLGREFAARLPEDRQVLKPGPGLTTVFSKTEDCQMLVLQYKNTVLDIEYRGDTDLRDCIPLYEAALI